MHTVTYFREQLQFFFFFMKTKTQNHSNTVFGFAKLSFFLKISIFGNAKKPP